MKLNLVADYALPGDLRFVRTFSIHSSNNLVGLRDMTATAFPTIQGEWVRVLPMTLQMCESYCKAQEVAHAWQRDYEAQGRRWDYITPFDKDEIEKEVA